MPRALILPALLLTLGCSAAPHAPENGPALELQATAGVRVLALELQPQAGALGLAGLLSLPRPLLATQRCVQVEGRDGQGEALFVQTVELDVRPGPAFRGGPRTAALRAELPAPASLAQVRVTLTGR
jgi:hypothetical protein